MNKKSFKKGFTLLELLVVIAIIGIIATVVLVALGSAKNKGSDAAVKSNLVNAAKQAEIFYNINTVAPNSYTSVCTNGTVGGILAIGTFVLTAAKASSLSSYATNDVGTSSTATCNDSPNSWAAEVPLKSASGINPMWCVDSAGTSKQTNNASIEGGTACP